MTAFRWASGLCILATLLSGTGCGEKDAQILGLQEQLAQLERDNDDLKSQLQYANQERDAARARMNELQSLLDECRRRLAQGPVQPAAPVNIPAPQPRGDGDWVTGGNVAMISLSQDVLFDSGRADLKNRGAIEAIARELNGQFSDKRYVLVIGHTDSDPIRKTKNLWSDNLDLSVNRGAAVVRELIKLGVEPRRLVAAGQGEYNPRAQGNDNAAKSRNRRVEVIAIGA
jgi:flagellar motor protein MotB